MKSIYSSENFLLMSNQLTSNENWLLVSFSNRKFFCLKMLFSLILLTHLYFIYTTIYIVKKWNMTFDSLLYASETCKITHYIFFSTTIQSLTWYIYFGASTSCSTQGLLLTPCSGITHGRLGGLYEVSGIKCVGYMQGNCPIHSTITLAPEFLSWTAPFFLVWGHI